jgi:hypothetical protein
VFTASASRGFLDQRIAVACRTAVGEVTQLIRVDAHVRAGDTQRSDDAA